MNRQTITDDLAWIAELEMTMDFRGPWIFEILYAPAFPVLFAECTEVPIFLEAYPMDPDHFPNSEAVARDMIYNRLQRVSLDEIHGSDERVSVSAVGKEDDERTQVFGMCVFDNDTYYAIAFSGHPDVIEQEHWRIEAMLSTITFGKNESYGRGMRGFFKMVGSQISESEVPVGQSRNQVKTWINARRRKSKRPQRPPEPPPTQPTSKTRRPPLDDRFTEFEKKLTQAPPPPTSSKLYDSDLDALQSFEDSLGIPPSSNAPTYEPEPWPDPWLPLSCIAPERAWDGPPGRLPVRFSAVSRERREMHLMTLADALPADISYHAERVFGLHESTSLNESMPCYTGGLDKLAILLEFVLQEQQGAVFLDEHLDVHTSRRAFSPLGRSIKADRALPMRHAIQAMIRDDDGTATDLVGWRLGWRNIQEHLPIFGLERHSVITPNRARQLAFCDLPGPFEGLDFQARINLWMELDPDGRRAVIGELHNLHLETPIEDVTRAFLKNARNPSIPNALKTRWALALGPRGTAYDYAQLFANLKRNELLSPAHSQHALRLISPCAGDPLSGRGLSISLIHGKLGHTFGALSSAGVLARPGGEPVAVALFARNIQTPNMARFVDQIRELAALLYTFVTDL